MLHAAAFPCGQEIPIPTRNQIWKCLLPAVIDLRMHAPQSSPANLRMHSHRPLQTCECTVVVTCKPANAHHLKTCKCSQSSPANLRKHGQRHLQTCECTLRNRHLQTCECRVIVTCEPANAQSIVTCKPANAHSAIVTYNPVNAQSSSPANLRMHSQSSPANLRMHTPQPSPAIL